MQTDNVLLYVLDGFGLIDSQGLSGGTNTLAASLGSVLAFVALSLTMSLTL